MGNKVVLMTAVVMLVALLGLQRPTPRAGAKFDFECQYVNTSYGGNGKPGWIQAGDMDGDGDLDLVVGGGFALFVYENLGGARRWRRHGNLDSTKRMGANAGVLRDVDGDGALDVVSAKFLGAIGWWQNPGGKLADRAWAFHAGHKGFANWYLHDLIEVDVDGDDDRELVANLHHNRYWQAPVRIYLLKPRVGQPWKVSTIQAERPGENHCHAGLDAADIDRDGDVDLAYSDGWYEQRAGGSWKWHRISKSIYGISNTRATDVDGDGRLDLVVSAGHHGKGVYWFRAPVDPVAGTWRRHTVDAAIVHPEGLQAHDFDGDGDVDLLVSELFFGEGKDEPKWTDRAHHLYVLENLGGRRPAWKRHDIAPRSYPSHLPYLVDLDADGDLDIISEATGTSVISCYLNSRLQKPLGR